MAARALTAWLAAAMLAAAGCREHCAPAPSAEGGASSSGSGSRVGITSNGGAPAVTTPRDPSDSTTDLSTPAERPAGVSEESPSRKRQVTVGVHRRLLWLDERSILSKLERMNAVLRANGPAPIEECASIDDDLDVGVEFELALLERFDVGNGDIRTDGEYEAVAALPYDFKVVNSITWCSCSQREHPSILGCSEQKKAVVVAVTGSGVEPIVWAHEYGHFAGLRHAADNRNVMFPYSDRCMVLVDAGQRALFREPTQVPAPQQTCPWDALPLLEPAASDSALEDQLREFVTATHVHGLPYEQARAFGARAHATDYLVGLLEDDAFREHRAQIALALGGLGGEQAIDRLMSVVDQARLDPQSPVLRTALPALGWALNAPKSEASIGKVLDFLVERTDVNAWKEAVGRLAPEERDAALRELAASAAMGLAFAGKHVGGRLEEAFSREKPEALRDVFEHLRRVNAAIRSSQDGDLAAYYAGR